MECVLSELDGSQLLSIIIKSMRKENVKRSDGIQIDGTACSTPLVNNGLLNHVNNSLEAHVRTIILNVG